MTVTLHFGPELEAGLLAQAQAHGMDVEHYLQTLLEQKVFATESNGAPEGDTRSEAVRRMLEFGEKHRLRFGEPLTRRSLHEGHRI